MKCAIEKAINKRWLETKAVAHGANAVIETIVEEFQKQVDALPEDQRKEAVISYDEFLKFMTEVKQKFNEEMGTDYD